MGAEITPKPWGHEEIVHRGAYVLKRLVVQQGRRPSLRLHERKTETLFVFRGHPEILLGKVVLTLQPGDTCHIPAGTRYRIAAGADEVEIIEASTPELEDVVRIEDDYGRVR